MRLILVGAGGVAREVVRRLGEAWSVTVVDPSRAMLDRLDPADVADVVVGDGSSRVVLRRAGLDDADAVVAATNSDEVNLEVCRLARDAGVDRVLAVVAEPERASAYRELSVPCASPDALAARRLELSLETRRIVSTAFADGRAEAIEFRVAPDAPVRGRALKDLHAERWIVGAILRGDRLVVPHGDTVLEAGDLVTVVGASVDFPDIVRTFTAGEGRFPLGWGKRIAVVLDAEADLGCAYAEAVELVRNTRAFSLVAVHRDPDGIRDEERAEAMRGLVERARAGADGVELHVRPVAGDPWAAVGRLPAEESVGAIVVGVPVAARLGGWRAVRLASRLATSTRVPVLLARGTHPYRRIVSPARQSAAGRAAARAAIDLARFYGVDLHTLSVEDPTFLVGPAPPERSRAAIRRLEEDASVQGVKVHGEIRRGNPIRTFRDFGEPSDLVVLAASRLGGGLVGRPSIARAVARRQPSSVLIVPVGDA